MNVRGILFYKRTVVKSVVEIRIIVVETVV